MRYSNAGVGNHAIDASLGPVVTLPVFDIVTRDCRCGPKRCGNARSSIDQHWNLAMCKHLDCLAAEDDRRDAVAAVRSHDDEVAAFRCRGVDDRLVGLFMLDLDRLADDAL